MSKYKPYIDALNDLYIMNRKKYLIYYKDNPSPVTALVSEGNNYKKLNDSFLVNHFTGEKTYGVFAGEEAGSKFICFDVDALETEEDKDRALKKNKHLTYRLINVLIEEFQVKYDEIHVSISGKKGYHVELFFDKPCRNKHIQTFYSKVLEAMNMKNQETEDNENGKIELRPTPKLGVKLPLGIHQGTKKRCWFVETNTLEPIESPEHVLQIKPMTLERFLFIVSRDEEEKEIKPTKHTENRLTATQRKSLDEIVIASDLTGRTIQQRFDYAEDVLRTGQLKYSGARHNTTLLLATYFNSIGQDREIAIDMITSVIESTPLEYFNDTTSLRWKINEIKRIVNIAYDNNYTFSGVKSQIEICKNEVEEVLKVQNFSEKLLLFVMLVHAKRYAKLNGQFYMAYSVMNRMVNGNFNRSALKKYMESLEKKGLLSIVSQNVIDKGRSKEEMEKSETNIYIPYKKPNVYKINIVPNPEESSQRLIIDNAGQVDLITVTKHLFTKEEVKKLVTKSQYYNTFKALYA